jgi:hypothetical protein
MIGEEAAELTVELPKGVENLGELIFSAKQGNHPRRFNV